MVKKRKRFAAKLICALLIVTLCVPVSFAEETEPAEPVTPDPVTIYEPTPVRAVFTSKNTSDVDALRVEWDEVADATYYYVYRQDPETLKWSRITDSAGKARTVNATYIGCFDTEAVSGQFNRYKVLAKRKVPGPAPEGALLKKKITDEEGSLGAWYLAPVKLTSVTRPMDDTLQVKWEGSENVEVQYAENMLFKNPVSQEVKGTEILLMGLKAKKTYYVRVRSILDTEDGNRVESSWALSPEALGPRTVSITYLKAANGKKFNLRAIAKLKRLHGYDTAQGGCTDGTYIYQIFENRITKKCKIAKFKKKSYQLVKVSKALKVGHGNDITYNSKTKELVVTYSGTKKYFVTTVNPKSLKIKKQIPVILPTHLSGLKASDVKNIEAYSAIYYDEESDQYLLKIRGGRVVLILNGSFKPIRAIVPPQKNTDITGQTIIQLGDYILRAQSELQSKDKNIINVFDRVSGSYVSTMNLKLSGELENMYEMDGKLYGTVFKKEYKTKYKKVKKKYKKKVKVKKKKGKWTFKWKTFVKYVKKKYKTLYRQAYTFIINVF